MAGSPKDMDTTVKPLTNHTVDQSHHKNSLSQSQEKKHVESNVVVVVVSVECWMCFDVV
jgi:hypothetical protein